MGDRLKAKVCLVGEAAVGKTRLVQRYVLDDYDDAYVQTLGTKVYKRALTVNPVHGGGPVAVDLSIWDIMGQKGFRELLKDAYFYQANGILAVCDVTRRGTLDDLLAWIDSVNAATGPVPTTVLANKADLADKAQIKEPDVADAAKRFGAPFFLTSAKTGENVARAFQTLAERIVERKAAPNPTR